MNVVAIGPSYGNPNFLVATRLVAIARLSCSDSRLLAGKDLSPYKYKGSQPVEDVQLQSNHLSLYFYLFPYPYFSNPYIMFFSRFHGEEGVLAGRSSLGQPLGELLPTCPSQTSSPRWRSKTKYMVVQSIATRSSAFDVWPELVSTSCFRANAGRARIPSQRNISSILKLLS